MKKTVKVGSVAVRVFQTAAGHFTLKWKEDGKWKNTSRAKLQVALDDARVIARRIQNAEADFTNALYSDAQMALFKRMLAIGITHADLDAFENARKTMKKCLKTAIAEFLDQKLLMRNGRDGAHMSDMRTILRKLQADHDGKCVSDLTKEDISKELESRQLAGQSPVSVRNYFVRLRGFILWAHKMGYANKNILENITLPEIRAKDVEIYTPDEFEALLARARSKNTDILIWLAFGGFAGLRAAEIRPTNSAKPGLMWENVRWDEGFIEVPAAVSKTNRRRIVPILPALRAWVEPLAKSSGFLIDTSEQNARFYKIFQGLKVIKNGSRHSFGSYRASALQSAGQVALEMGNSESVVKKHYMYAVPPTEAEQWWALAPKVV